MGRSSNPVLLSDSIALLLIYSGSMVSFAVSEPYGAPPRGVQFSTDSMEPCDFIMDTLNSKNVFCIRDTVFRLT